MYDKNTVSFTMPDKDISIGVNFKDAKTPVDPGKPSDPDTSQSPKNNISWLWIAGGVAAAAAVAGVIAAVFIKKKRS